MKAEELCFLTIAELSPLIKKRQVSPVELAQATLERIERLNERLNAYITVCPEEALGAAREAERAILAGNYLGPLHGIPIALKDLYNTKGIRTTSGSKILADFVPAEDGTVVERLKKAGAIIPGKTNLHEFALGATSENPHYGPSRNPWDTARITGGSSGGSAAAVAASLAIGAMGSDSGGSIRIPACLCGIVGLKPTYGRVSRYGTTPLCWSLDTMGPLARSVEDAALMLGAIAGHDPRDPSSSRTPVPDYTSNLAGGVKGLRVGLPREYFFETLEDEVREAVGEAIRVLEGLGASPVEASLPRAERGIEIAWLIIAGEAASIHQEWFRTRADEYGEDVRLRLEMGQFLTATQYLRAQRARRVLKRDFLEALKEAHVILTPTIPLPAPRIGERSLMLGGKKVMPFTGLGRFTAPINPAGLPAISVPCGFAPPGLPLGLQIVGRPFDEETVLRAAYAYEASTDWHQKRPEL
jgi:aspartyl-tRNA(Asn)/glutamyl-tRNA(Gln) amidotransferase subunit A